MTTLLQMPYGLVLPPALMAVFFVWGFLAARSRGRSGVVWGIACAVTFFIGIAILYSLGARSAAPIEPDEAAVSLYEPPRARSEPPVKLTAGGPPPAPASAIVTGESADDRRWRYLCEYHPAIRDAVADVAPLGEDALYELKAAHLAIGDFAVLPDIVERLGERFGASRIVAAGRNGVVIGTMNGHASANRAPESALLQHNDEEDDDEPLVLAAPIAAKEIARESSRETARRPVAYNGARGDSAKSIAVVTAAALPLKTAAAELSAAAEAEFDDAELVATVNAPMPSDDLTDDEAGFETETAQAPAAAAKPLTVIAAAAVKPPGRTDVTPSDLVGAKFLETYAGVHLFGLVDGRVFIDRHEARTSLDLARSYVDQVAVRRSVG